MRWPANSGATSSICTPVVGEGVVFMERHHNNFDGIEALIKNCYSRERRQKRPSHERCKKAAPLRQPHSGRQAVRRGMRRGMRARESKPRTHDARPDRLDAIMITRYGMS